MEKAALFMWTKGDQKNRPRGALRGNPPNDVQNDGSPRPRLGGGPWGAAYPCKGYLKSPQPPFRTLRLAPRSGAKKGAQYAIFRIRFRRFPV